MTKLGGHWLSDMQVIINEAVEVVVVSLFELQFCQKDSQVVRKGSEQGRRECRSLTEGECVREGLRV